MTDKLMALLALAVLTAYLVILVVYVPRLDLGLIIGATLLLVAYDFLIHEHRRKSSATADDAERSAGD
ncbi:hypothetical protein ACUNV4_13130 [Granulosicoccus sp. 3-233]|uniref:hypothetical protein n=1 Tax=Granulosicoccus sp. 3-233 TaxID=3417969 RepID=UPI003D3521D9